jgi:hypothetical protein
MTLKDLSLCKFHLARLAYLLVFIVQLDKHPGTRLTTTAVEWKDLRVMELNGTGWAVIIGHKRREASPNHNDDTAIPLRLNKPSANSAQQDQLRAVLPLPLHTTSLKPSSLQSIFAALSALSSPYPSTSPSSSSIPPPLPPLVPDLDDLRRELAAATLTAGASGGGANTSTSTTTTTTTQPKTTSDEQVKLDGQREAGDPNGEKADEEGNKELDTEMIYLGITIEDSTVVYYKLSKGIKKPADIPDE